MFIEKTKGIKTAEAVYKSAKKNGRLLSIKRDPFIYGYHKYFKIEADIYDILIVDGEVIYANKIPATWENVMNAYVPDFGGF